MCCTSWLMIKWSKLNVVSMENANGKCHPNHQFGKNDDIEYIRIQYIMYDM